MRLPPLLAAAALVFSLAGHAAAEEENPDAQASESAPRLKALVPELHAGGGFDVNVSGAHDDYGGGLLGFVGGRLRLQDRLFVGAELEGASLVVKDHRVGGAAVLGAEFGRSVRPFIAVEGGAHGYFGVKPDGFSSSCGASAPCARAGKPGGGTLPFLGLRAGIIVPQNAARTTNLVIEVAVRNEPAKLGDSYDDRVAATSRTGGDARTDVTAMNVQLGAAWESALRLGVTFR